MARVRILLADDHTLFCNLLRELLEPKYEVVGSVSDGHELLKAARLLRPDVVLIEIGMPALNGLDAGRRLKQEHPHIKLIYLTMNNNAQRAREAFQAGASGFVLKNEPSSQLLRAIHDRLARIVLDKTLELSPLDQNGFHHDFAAHSRNATTAARTSATSDRK
jgi:DNA-binding NarL/FixJ family response regulator